MPSKPPGRSTQPMPQQKPEETPAKTFAEQLAERLGTDDQAKQIEQLDELLLRVQVQPVTISFVYDPFANKAHLAGVSAQINHDGLQIASAAFAQHLIELRMQEQLQAAEKKPAVAEKQPGRRGQKASAA